MSESSEPEKSDKPAVDADQLELKLPDESSAPKDLALWAGVLVLLTLIAYWPATTGSFLWRDDRAAQSPQFVGAGGLSRIWFDRWEAPARYGLPVYQPAALTAYYLEYQLGGHTAQGAPSPVAYHIASLIFLAGSAILLWFVLRELKLRAAWLIAGVFALHPIHAESVSWIDQQPIVLAGLFFLGSIFTYLLFIRSFDRDRAERAAGQAGVDPAQTWGLCVGSVVLALLAMLSDPSAFVLPAVIMLMLWWQKRITSRDMRLQWGLLIVGALLWLKDTNLPAVDAGSLIRADFTQQAIAIGRGLAHAAGTLIAPLGLSVIYPASATGAPLLMLAIAVILLVILFLMSETWGRGLFFAFATFALLAAASVNWFDSSRRSIIGDGTAYLAMIPLEAVVILFIASRIRSIKLPATHAQTVVGASTLCLLILGSSAWLRTHVFESPVAMWQNMLSKHPDYVYAESSLAEQLRLRALSDMADDNKTGMDGDFAAAIEHAKAALKLDSANSAAQRTWANALVAQGDDAGALPHFAAALAADPDNSNIEEEYGSALVTLGQFQASCTPCEAARAGSLTKNQIKPAHSSPGTPARKKALRQPKARAKAVRAIGATKEPRKLEPRFWATPMPTPRRSGETSSATMEWEMGITAPSAAPISRRAPNSMTKVVATPDSTEQTEKARPARTMNTFFLPARSDQAPTKIPDRAQVNDRAEDSSPTWEKVSFKSGCT